MGAIGLPELLIVLVFGLFSLVPLAAAIWALVTLSRIRSAQEALAVKLDALERLLRQPS